MCLDDSYCAMVLSVALRYNKQADCARAFLNLCQQCGAKDASKVRSLKGWMTLERTVRRYHLSFGVSGHHLFVVCHSESVVIIDDL